LQASFSRSSLPLKLDPLALDSTQQRLAGLPYQFLSCLPALTPQFPRCIANVALKKREKHPETQADQMRPHSDTKKSAASNSRAESSSI